MFKSLFILLTFFVFTTTSYASSLRIEAKELFKNQKTYKIIDTRDFKTYKKGHIKNAINFPISLSYANLTINGKLTDPFSMQKIIQNLGLQENDKLIVYDDGSFFDAARLFWALEVYGFKDIKLLNAGYKQWLKKGYPSDNTLPNITKSNYITIINTNRIATKFSTLIATKNPNQIIIDARPNKAYKGKISSAQRYGHIPKAINIPASHNIDSSISITKLKTLSELAKLYSKVDKDKKIILYCAVGKISATNYFALRELGYNVSNYDASWREWGNDFKLDIVNLSEKE